MKTAMADALAARCARRCAARGRPPPQRAARACRARHATATGALAAPRVGRSLSGCARCSWRSPPPGWSYTSGPPWHTPHPCPRRLNPARTAAARAALRVAIACVLTFVCAGVRRCTPLSHSCRGMGSIPAAIYIYAARRARQCAACGWARAQRGVSSRDARQLLVTVGVSRCRVG